MAGRKGKQTNRVDLERVSVSPTTALPQEA